MSAAPAEAPATVTAREMVRELVAHGVQHAVLCPGSRSAPLAYALLAAHEAGWLRLHVRVDERVAGFVALGLARGQGAPVPVVTTSGTAVANLHPAVLEAAHSGLPLVVLSADRPHELRGTGANQTTDQTDMFGSAARWSADVPAGAPGGPALRQVLTRALAAAEGRRTNDPGPVHLNVAFREPLAPSATWQPGPVPRPVQVVAPTAAPEPVEISHRPRTVVVAGDGAGPAARRLAEDGGWPLLAEPSSGARAGAHAVPAYRVLLGEAALTGDVERVLVLGHPTLSRPVSALLARQDVEIVVVAPRGPWTDVAGTAHQIVPAAAVVGAPTPAGTRWLGRWQRAGRAAEQALRQHLDGEPDRLDGLVVAHEVGAASAGSTDGPTVVLGSSSTVRDADLVLPAGAEGGPPTVANRGLAGIDGTVSTAAGVALATGGPVRAVMGDLTFLHDAGGLLRGRLEPEVDLQVIVLNDTGGGLFATLEHGAPERAAEFERIFGTPQEVDLASLAGGYGARHVRVRSRAELRAVLAGPVRERSVVEVVVDRRDLRERRARLTAAMQAAAHSALA